MHRYMEAQRSGGRRGVKRPRGRGAWMGAGLRAQIEKYNNKVIRPGGHWFVIGEGAATNSTLVAEPTGSPLP